MSNENLCTLCQAELDEPENYCKFKEIGKKCYLDDQVDEAVFDDDEDDE
jgi:hypothetical protein